MDLQKILHEHQLWINNQGGYKADLCGADLLGANLRGVNLCGADLRGANLYGADLRGAHLRGVNLCGANLRGANLYGAHLRGAYLRGADLRGADLRGADLYGADLYGAHLREADLCEADLRGADLREAYLREADLLGANLLGANLPHFLIVPETGSFYAWKKTTKGVIKIQIPTSAKRINPLVGRKCRASKVKVISGPGLGGYSLNEGSLLYNKGTIVVADSFDDDIRIECTHGIHFFITKKEAEEWN